MVGKICGRSISNDPQARVWWKIETNTSGHSMKIFCEIHSDGNLQKFSPSKITHHTVTLDQVMYKPLTVDLGRLDYQTCKHLLVSTSASAGVNTEQV